MGESDIDSDGNSVAEKKIAENNSQQQQKNKNKNKK